MHYHIYSFCGLPNCKDQPYHGNTEDLVSPPCTPRQVREYFEYGDIMPDELSVADEAGLGEYAIVTCAGGPLCFNNEVGTWLFVRQTDAVLRLFRPQHASAAPIDYDTKNNGSWARPFRRA